MHDINAEKKLEYVIEEMYEDIGHVICHCNVPVKILQKYVHNPDEYYCCVMAIEYALRKIGTPSKYVYKYKQEFTEIYCDLSNKDINKLCDINYMMTVNDIYDMQIYQIMHLVSHVTTHSLLVNNLKAAYQRKRNTQQHIRLFYN